MISVNRIGQCLMIISTGIVLMACGPLTEEAVATQTAEAKITQTVEASASQTAAAEATQTAEAEATPVPPLAACDSVIDVDTKEAAENPDYAEGDTLYHVFWSIHFNFSSYDEDTGNPIGCFKLYARNTQANDFVEIDGGGFAIETCTNHGVELSTTASRLSFKAKQPVPSNNQTRITTGVATFRANQNTFIECDFSIRQLTEDVVGSTPDEAWLYLQSGLNDTNSSPSEIIGELETLMDPERNFHVLKTLTLVSAGNIPSSVGLVENPIFYYVPDINDGTVECELDAMDDGSENGDSNSICTPFGMGIVTIPDFIEGGAIRSYLQGNLFQGQSEQLLPPDPNCTYAEGDNYWWTDFGVSNNINPALKVRSMLTDFPLPECDNIQFAEIGFGDPDFQDPEPLLTPLPSPPPVNRVAVWTGPTKLYIGCRPNVREHNENDPCETYLDGELFGIVIDPPNSKPQAE